MTFNKFGICIKKIEFKGKKGSEIIEVVMSIRSYCHLLTRLNRMVIEYTRVSVKTKS